MNYLDSMRLLIMEYDILRKVNTCNYHILQRKIKEYATLNDLNKLAISDFLNHLPTTFENDQKSSRVVGHELSPKYSHDIIIRYFKEREWQYVLKGYPLNRAKFAAGDDVQSLKKNPYARNKQGLDKNIKESFLLDILVAE